MQRVTARGRRVRGWTLVELIIVIMSTLILGVFVWKAASTTLSWANNSRMSIEVSQMSQAVENFSSHFGEYPPDFSDQMAVWKFMKAHFPQCPREKYPSFACHSPASALFFWLGGPNGNGFSNNPANPFDNCKRRIGPFFRFDRTRIKEVEEGVTHFYPPRSRDGLPYVYFRGGQKGYDGLPFWGSAKPYRDSAQGKWIRPESFQILCPGNDGVFGSGNHYPGGTDYDQANMDDITNFSHGETLGQQMPKVVPDKSKKNEDDVSL
jgi:hypothetical protein